MRLTSLDVFRGITIAAMILVNMAGVADDVYLPLTHADWHGCTPTDLVFPFFLFIVGVAMSFSLSKYTAEKKPNSTVYWRILRRAAILFALGLLLNGFWNKGVWIQNRANMLAIWCMFAQVIPEFQDSGRFAVLPVLYKNGVMNPAVHPGAADPTMMGVITILSLVINVVVFAIIWKRATSKGINPYTHEVFVGTKDYEEAMARAQK